MTAIDPLKWKKMDCEEEEWMQLTANESGFGPEYFDWVYTQKKDGKTLVWRGGLVMKETWIADVDSLTVDGVETDEGVPYEMLDWVYKPKEFICSTNFGDFAVAVTFKAPSREEKETSDDEFPDTMVDISSFIGGDILNLLGGSSEMEWPVAGGSSHEHGSNIRFTVESGSVFGYTATFEYRNFGGGGAYYRVETWSGTVDMKTLKATQTHHSVSNNGEISEESDDAVEQQWSVENGELKTPNGSYSIQDGKVADFIPGL